MTDADTATPRRRSRLRWLVAGGGAAVLAGVVGTAVVLHAAAAPACAASRQGKATFYDSAGSGGNCSFPSAPPDRLYVALGPTEYAASAACGSYLDVTGPKGTVRVLVTDQCPECAPGHLDLSAEAFARIADPVQGVVPVSYRAVVNPPLPGALTFRVKEGSSQWWFAVLVGDHGNPLSSVEVRTGSSWRRLVRADYNYWLADSGLGPGPYTIRVTDAYGNRAVADGIRLLPGQTQRSTVRMYGAGQAARTTAATPRSPAARPSPTVSATPTRTASATPSPDAAEAPATPTGSATPAVALAAQPGADTGCG